MASPSTSGSRKPPKISFPLQIPRYESPRAAAEIARHLEASGVVDDLLIYDYLVSFTPRSLWAPDVTPLANTYPDDDSYHDAFILAAIATAASNLGVTIMTDSMRRGPWVVQTMMSLAGATPGQVTLAMGAGESRHGKPFGYARNEGIGRQRDLMKIWNLFLDCDGPVDYDGKYWKLEQTYLGTIRPARPKLYALGGGPKLIETAALYADGLMTQLPSVWSTPQQTGEAIAGIKAAVAANGRDPDKFDIGMSVFVVVSDDPAFIEKTLQHPISKFWAAIFGRLAMSDWVKEGFEPPFPVDWHYANNLYPVTITRAECDAAINRMTPEMMRKSYLVGSAAEVAAQIQEFIDVGVTTVVPFDVGGIVNQDPMGSVARQIEVSRILKGNA